MIKRILLGRIGAAHGLRGEVVVTSFARESLDIAAYGPLTDAGGTLSIEFVSMRQAGKGIVARLQGIDDRTAAEALRGTELFVARERLPAPLPEDFYIADLIGLKAVAPGGEHLGHVVDVPNYGAGDLIEITPAGAGESILVAFTKDFVPAIDFVAGTMTVVMPQLNQAEPGEATEEE